MDPTPNQLASLAKKHGITLILRFGSSVTGKVHASSDIDLAVRVERVPYSLDAYSELQHDLQQLYPEGEVDIAFINRADPLLLKQITDACHLVYGSVRDLQELKIYAFKRYQDHRKYLALERRYVEHALRNPGSHD
jgi:predicted nucleotidyltransferase